ncbi:MAG: Maf family protein [Planctomycetaceae bacterium]|nr:Maf family protein [Planctomycetaceae bacterium]
MLSPFADNPGKHTVVLGSQSPRRRELMQSVIPSEQLIVLPPQNAAEAGFDDCDTEAQIEARIQEITGAKLDDVKAQVDTGAEVADGPAAFTVVCADTIVVVREPGSDSERPARVLGKPPVSHWQPVVRDWFQRYYANGPHEVWTCFGVANGSRRQLQTVRTSVTLGAIDDWWIDWYLSTDEPVGKAGGYGIQGLAAHLVQSVEGSLTNVIGLPMMELVAVLREVSLLTDGDRQ